MGLSNFSVEDPFVAKNRGSRETKRYNRKYLRFFVIRAMRDSAVIGVGVERGPSTARGLQRAIDDRDDGQRRKTNRRRIEILAAGLNAAGAR